MDGCRIGRYRKGGVGIVRGELSPALSLVQEEFDALHQRSGYDEAPSFCRSGVIEILFLLERMERHDCLLIMMLQAAW